MYRCLVHLSLIIIQFNTYKLILQHKTFWRLKWVSITIDKYVGNASVPHVGRGKEVRQLVVTIGQMDQMASRVNGMWRRNTRVHYVTRPFPVLVLTNCCTCATASLKQWGNGIFVTLRNNSNGFCDFYYGTSVDGTLTLHARFLNFEKFKLSTQGSVF